MSAEQAPAVDDRQMQILTDEMSRLQTMYLDARNNAQSVFNFYLSFLTAVIGGIVFLVQIQPEDEAGRAEGLVIALLFFAAMVGSVYMGALSGRYGHAARFARALDALRREAIRVTRTPLPRLYDSFLSESDADARPPQEVWYIWLVPTGSYQMFMAFVNSASLALMVLLIGSEGDASGSASVAAAVIVFLMTLTVYNVYSRLIIQRFVRSLDVRIDMGSSLGAWAARQ